jgi:hypothetical protein
MSASGAVTASVNSLVLVDSTTSAVAVSFAPTTLTDGLTYVVKWQRGGNPVTFLSASLPVEEIPPNQGTYLSANTPQTMPNLGDSVTYAYDAVRNEWYLAA